MSSWFKHIENFLGIEKESVSSAEKFISALGGVLGIWLIAEISFRVTGAQGASLIVPSMGASAVLLFAVPHGRLSQPWQLIGGHLISAFIGVTCFKLVPDTFLAAGLAVGISIGVMHIMGCIHPPGGATALAAVIGGASIHQLGYRYMLTPIGLNTAVIFVTAVIFNYAFPWRRYPVYLMRFTDSKQPTAASPQRSIEKEYIEQAIEDMDLIVDLTTSDLQRLFTLTLEHAERQELHPEQIFLGHYYTNGKKGAEWCVRQIIDEARSDDPNKDMVIYRVVEGVGLRSADSCTRSDFSKWASREVIRNHPVAESQGD